VPVVYGEYSTCHLDHVPAGEHTRDAFQFAGCDGRPMGHRVDGVAATGDRNFPVSGMYGEHVAG
jgi:hypothetical protein